MLPHNRNIFITTMAIYKYALQQYLLFILYQNHEVYYATCCSEELHVRNRVRYKQQPQDILLRRCANSGGGGRLWFIHLPIALSLRRQRGNPSTFFWVEGELGHDASIHPPFAAEDMRVLSWLPRGNGNFSSPLSLSLPGKFARAEVEQEKKVGGRRWRRRMTRCGDRPHAIHSLTETWPFSPGKTECEAKLLSAGQKCRTVRQSQPAEILRYVGPS